MWGGGKKKTGAHLIVDLHNNKDDKYVFFFFPDHKVTKNQERDIKIRFSLNFDNHNEHVILIVELARVLALQTRFVEVGLPS